MAGHSKWANIKFRKGAQDAKRGKIFTKLIREITMATRLSGPDPQMNPRLRAAIDKALSNNMSRDTIDRAVKRAAGAGEEADLQEVVYEGYGVGGTAVLVSCLTDNRNRTVSEVRHAFSKFGGNLGTDGSVAYLFQKVGMLVFSPMTEAQILDAALEAGADDIVVEGDTIEVRTRPEDLMEVRNALTAAGFTSTMAEITYVATTMAPLQGEQAEMFIKMVERLEELDDVQDVYFNADIADDILESA